MLVEVAMKKKGTARPVSDTTQAPSTAERKRARKEKERDMDRGKEKRRNRSRERSPRRYSDDEDDRRDRDRDQRRRRRSRSRDASEERAPRRDERKHSPRNGGLATTARRIWSRF